MLFQTGNTIYVTFLKIVIRLHGEIRYDETNKACCEFQFTGCEYRFSNFNTKPAMCIKAFIPIGEAKSIDS